MAAVAAVAAGFEFGLEFVEASGARRRETLPTCWNVPFEDAVSIRPFGWSRGRRHFPGWWWSATTGDHVMLLGFDRDVAGLASAAVLAALARRRSGTAPRTGLLCPLG
ncbi:hypothetical protein [Frankia sp. Cas4]|uniref:hypothetical protein n=1 Tax=Frankia sp. Cas4 TaxID=3073927 RepID=UPI002AD597BA|nr:hypothetical protein [Frankia sp. Cas4]